MSSDSESDEEYVPGEPEKLSEEDSADDETELQYEDEVGHKPHKRKSLTKQKNVKKIKMSNGRTRTNHTGTNEPEEEPAQEEVKDIELEKKKEDDLWAMFLDGTDTCKSKTSAQNAATKPVEKSAATSKTPVKLAKDAKDNMKSREAKIFEFAGQTVVVEGDEIKEVSSTASSSSESSAKGTRNQPAPLKRGSGGLASVLGQLNKKNTLSTLEKSKLDWNTYKKKEGIEEELQTFNKGKDGYLERQDFLERADVRQFEIERSLRSTRRSNR